MGLVVGSIPTRGNEMFINIYIFIFHLPTLRCAGYSVNLIKKTILTRFLLIIIQCRKYRFYIIFRHKTMQKFILTRIGVFFFFDIIKAKTILDPFIRKETYYSKFQNILFSYSIIFWSQVIH